MRIQDTSVSDSGEYECQVTTPNATVIIVNLNVLGRFIIQIIVSLRKILG